MDVLASVKRRLGMLLSVALYAASTLGVGLPSTVAAQESHINSGAKQCSRAEFERMMEQKAWGKCQGEFLAGTPDQMKEARILQEFQERQTSDQTQSSVTPQGIVIRCGWKANGDYVHISSEELALSGHGWWQISYNFQCPNTATVTTVLYGLYGTPQYAYWREIGRDSRTIGAKNFTGEQGTARRACTETGVVSYYSKIKVNFSDGRSDSFSTNEQTIACYPYPPDV